MPKRPLLDAPPIPAPHRADSQQIVHAIVAAAMELGPETSLAAIADRAGVGMASLHRYFPTVGSIYAEVSRQMYRTVLTQIRVVLADAEAQPDLRAVVHRICLIAFDGPNVSLDYRRKLNLDLPLIWSKGIAEVVYQEMLAEISDWLGRHLVDPPADLASRVFIAFAYLRGSVLLSLLYPDLAPPRETMIEHLTNTVVQTISQPG